MNKEFLINRNPYYIFLSNNEKSKPVTYLEEASNKDLKNYPGFFSRWFFNNFEDKFVSNFRELLVNGIEEVLNSIVNSTNSSLSYKITNELIEIVKENIEESLTKMKLQLKNIKKISDEDLNNYFYNFVNRYGSSSLGNVLKDKAKFSAKLLALAFHRPLVSLNVLISKSMKEMLEEFSDSKEEFEKYKSIFKEIDSVKFVFENEGGTPVIEKKLLTYFEEIFYQVFFLSGKYRESYLGSSIKEIPSSFFRRIKNFRYSVNSILFKICFTILLPIWLNINLIKAFENFFKFFKDLKDRVRDHTSRLGYNDSYFDGIYENPYFYLFLQRYLIALDKKILVSLSSSINKAGKYVGKRFSFNFFSSFVKGIREVFKEETENYEENFDKYLEEASDKFKKGFLERGEILEKNKDLIQFLVFLILANKNVQSDQEYPYLKGLTNGEISFLEKINFIKKKKGISYEINELLEGLKPKYPKIKEVFNNTVKRIGIDNIENIANFSQGIGRFIDINKENFLNNKLREEEKKVYMILFYIMRFIKNGKINIEDFRNFINKNSLSEDKFEELLKNTEKKEKPYNKEKETYTKERENPKKEKEVDKVKDINEDLTAIF